MSLRISLTPEAQERLKARALAAGQSVEAVAPQILEHEARRATVEELSGPVYQNFLASGITDDELSQHLDEAKHAMRAQRRKSPTP